MATPLYHTRRRLVTAIKKNGPMAVVDLAEELGITGMAVRKHLAGLERDRFVASTLERRGTGRPRYLYSLTPQAHELFPQGYNQMALDVLDDVAQTHGEAEVQRILNRRSERLTERYKPVLEGKDIMARVAELARLRDEDGFLAVWEQEGDDLVLREYHCPHLDVASAHPQACALELEMLRSLLPETEVSRSHVQTQGQHVCTYRIHPKGDAAAEGHPTPSQGHPASQPQPTRKPSARR